jgi:molecular chaperone DnaK
MELRGVLESSDVAEIKAKTDALQQAWTEAAQALYAQASSSSSQSQPGNAGDGSAPSDDEVVEDAEYEVVDE